MKYFQHGGRMVVLRVPLFKVVFQDFTELEMCSAHECAVVCGAHDFDDYLRKTSQGIFTEIENQYLKCRRQVLKAKIKIPS